MTDLKMELIEDLVNQVETAIDDMFGAMLDDVMPQASLSLTLQLLACGDEALLSVHGPIPLPGKRWN